MTSLLLIVALPGLLQTGVALATIWILRRKQGRAHEAGGPLPPCAVIMPSKGIPPGFESTLRAHARACAATGSRFLVCVESADDSGVPLITAIAREFKSLELVVAGLAQTSSQQNHNMLAGVAAARGAEVLAFADNDFTPPAGWLQSLVRPLSQESVTVTTGYRWIMGSGAPSGHFHVFAGMVMVAWFVPLCWVFGGALWGGSFALRRREFENLGVAKRWRTSISDDLTLTAALSEHGKRAHFVRELLIPTTDCIYDLRQAFRWFERQILNTKAHARPLWGLMVFGLSLEGAGLLLPLFALLALSLEDTAALGPELARNGGLAWAFSVTSAALYQGIGSSRGKASLIAMAPLLRLALSAAALRTLFADRILWSGVWYRFDRTGVVTEIERPSQVDAQ